MKDIVKVQNGKVNKFPVFVIVFLIALLVVAFIPLINTTTVASSINMLEERGYVVLSSAEYALIAKEATASAAVANAEAAVLAAHDAADTVLADLHATQYVYPELANSITLPADGIDVWKYGALTEVIPANTITSKFHLHGISISNMSVTSSYVVRITYGAGDTEWGFFRVSRGGALANSAVIQIQGMDIPANSVVKMQVADAGGIGTLDVSVYYHIAQ